MAWFKHGTVVDGIVTDGKKAYDIVRGWFEVAEEEAVAYFRERGFEQSIAKPAELVEAEPQAAAAPKAKGKGKTKAAADVEVTADETKTEGE
ncbi:MAG: hypothetical protein QJR03_12165 [Sphaerobacter sp.]|nr:hypothetical protein [Sphaerobacter sp.]